MKDNFKVPYYCPSILKAEKEKEEKRNEAIGKQFLKDKMEEITKLAKKSIYIEGVNAIMNIDSVFLDIKLFEKQLKEAKLI